MEYKTILDQRRFLWTYVIRTFNPTLDFMRKSSHENVTR